MMNKEFHTVRGYQLLEQNKRHLTSAMEDYLEMIYRNSREEGYIRISRLAQLLNVRAPSASKMVQKLSELGLLKFKKYGIIMLNEDGREIGEYLLERHILLEGFLKLLGCEDDLLQQTELMEHTVNPELLKLIKVFSNFFQDHKEIMEQYKEYKHRSDHLEI
jgi:Mn-dependent DtxR family transcriptional regulator